VDGVERRAPLMGLGALVLLVASFKPWFAYGSGATYYGGSNAWGSRIWAAAVLAGMAATLIWFGALTMLPARWRPVVAAALLVVGLALAAREWWAVPDRTYTVATITYRDPGNPPEIPMTPRPFWLEFEPAHYTAVAALAGMLAVAATAVAGQFRPGGGRRPVAG
jgi:hypothetical protein